MSTLTHWHILGAGSMGCLWAFYLRKAGHTVTLIAKNRQQAQELQAALPLTLLNNGETRIVHDIHITSIGQLSSASASIQHLLICLKVWQTADALEAIKSAMATNATVVLLQNGMGNQHLLQSTLPHCANYAAITTEAACKRAALTVEHTGTGNTQLGALGIIEDNGILDKMHCGITSIVNPKINTALWQKLVINCCINPLTAIYRCNNGELANKTEAQATITSIIDECRAVAIASDAGIDLNTIEQQVADVIQKTARNTSSMLQDILQQRQTEINYINGYIVSLGLLLGIDTPVNRSLVTQIEKTGNHPLA